jgi:histone H2B
MKEETGRKKRRKRKRVETYNTHIYKTLKKTQQKMSISYKAMSIMNSFMKDMFERIVTEAAKNKAKQQET